MRILNSYITRDNVVMFLISLAIFLFVMAVGNIFRIIDLISRGVSFPLILQVFSYGMPYWLIFAVPMSILAATFLQFSRMADDREIIAMKACGISIWQIVQPPAVVATLLCLLCLYINCWLAPASHYARRKVIGKLGVETPMSLIDEGLFVRDFPGLAIYVERKYGNRLSNIVVHQFGENGLKQTIHARSGVIEMDADESQKAIVRLKDVRVELADDQDPENIDLIRHVSVEDYPMTIDMSQIARSRTIWKKRADLSMGEVISGIRGEPVFSREDFIDIENIAIRIRDPNDPVGAAIRSTFSSRTNRLLDVYDGSNRLSNLLDIAIVFEFNRLLHRQDLYEMLSKAGVVFDRETASLFARTTPSGVSLTRMNRKMLEEAFPREIAQNHLLKLSPREEQVHRMSMMIEASTRVALSFSCYAFALLGAALGVKIHRKESSIGLAVTLGLIFFFYFFIIAADSLVSHPELQPHLIVWFPFLISEGVGYHLLRRAA